MREIHDLSFDIDRFLEDAARAKQQLDVERWREELRPRALRVFAARTAKLQWSRALLKLVVRELYPDDLFAELIGNLDRVPRRRWPQVVALAVALRYSWRQDGLARIVRSLHVSRRSVEDRAHSPQLPTHSRRSTRKSFPSKRATRKSRRAK
jgi:hypothetical protein